MTLKVTSNNNETVHCMPTYMVSEDLTNSPHVDVFDRSRSYAIWFQSVKNWDTEKNRNGNTFFLFPEFSLAIRICGDTLISWDGRNMQHCSCTTKKGIYSTAKLAGHRIFQLANSEMQFDSKPENYHFQPNDKVIIREPCVALNGKNYKYTKATLVSLNKNEALVRFNSKKTESMVKYSDIAPYICEKNFSVSNL